MSNSFKVAVAGLLSIFALVGGLYGFSEYVAKQEDVEQIAQVQRYHLMDVRRGSIQDRIWRMEERYGHGNPCCMNWSARDAREWKELQVERARVEREMGNIMR